MSGYDYNGAGNFVKQQDYAEDVRDKIGDTFIAIPGTIQENTQETFENNKEGFKEEILEELEPTAVAAEVIAARDEYAALDARLDNMQNQRGTCSTAAATAAKVVTKAGFKLYTGTTITVAFTNANTASNPTLNVNLTGAKGIRYRGANLASEQYWGAGDTVQFIYDGSYFNVVDGGALARVPNGSLIVKEDGIVGIISEIDIVPSTALIPIINRTGNFVINNEIILEPGYLYKIITYFSCVLGDLYARTSVRIDDSNNNTYTNVNIMPTTYNNIPISISNNLFIIDRINESAQLKLHLQNGYLEGGTVKIAPSGFFLNIIKYLKV